MFERSARDPGRLYALIVSATWCEPCKALKEELQARPSTATAADAAWALTEVDRSKPGALEALLKPYGDPPRAYPSVLVLHEGRPLGYTDVGSRLERIERFLKEAAKWKGAPVTGRPALRCSASREWASFTLGLSGLGAKGGDRSDWFGRSVLPSLRPSGSRAVARFFAPPRLSSMTRVASEHGDGFFFAPDPAAEFAPLFEPLDASTRALAALSSAPGDRLRLVLSGHASPEGMLIGTQRRYAILDWDSPVHLDATALIKAAYDARRAGKELRGLVTTCYAGQFAPAFMPLARAAPACAAFATLPEKLAEGCYGDPGAERRDYVAALSAASCLEGRESARARHYRALATTPGADVPMLSSEYFLLYGAVGAFLGRLDRQPAPPGGLILRRFDDGVELVVDLVAGRVAAARLGGKELPLPQASITDCRQNEALSFDQSNFFFLRGRVSDRPGKPSAACTPELAVEWSAEQGVELARRHVLLGPALAAPIGTLEYRPSSEIHSGWDDDFIRALGGPPEVDARGLKTEARSWLAAVWPRFRRPLTGAALAAELGALARRAGKGDPELGAGLEALIARARLEAASLTGPVPSSSELASALGVPPSERAAREPEEPEFSSDRLARLMLDNLGPGEIRRSDVFMARLAHVASAASAELALREQAEGSRKAAELLAQLDALKRCERGLLD